MQTNQITYTLQELLNRLGLEYRPTSEGGKMDCPFCGKKKKLNLKFATDSWRCPVCGASGHVLHFYAQYCLDMPNIPSDRAGRGKLAADLRVFMDGFDRAEMPPQRKPSRPAPQIIDVADDDRLTQVYETLLRHPAVQLIKEHKEALRARGLSRQAIERNQYRSIPEYDKVMIDPAYIAMYQEESGDLLRKQNDLKKLTADQVKLGLMIADFIVQYCGEPVGVPGFFKFGKRWCYWCIPGILIPGRNITGQIVCMQVRKNRLLYPDEAKYISVANKSLPGHTTEGTSRAHFPVGNVPLSLKAPVIFTEGFLKADVACHLYGGPVTFIAIPGVNTTKDLLQHSQKLLDAGIDCIQNGFDMDRLTNHNVKENSVKLVKAFAERGITVLDSFWGKRYAIAKLTAMELVVKYRNISLPEPVADESVFVRLDKVASALDEAKIDVNSYRVKGKRVYCYWDPETKGIDDFLFNYRRAQME